MNILPITPENPVCFGVCCPIHGTCQRYADVDGNSDMTRIVTDNCGPEHALYVAMLPVVDQVVA